MKIKMQKLFAILICLAVGPLMASSTIWLIGDSTVATYPEARKPLAGWGQVLNEYCNPDVVVKNHAVSGTTTRSFVTRKYWEKVLPELEEGDFLFIQFGHNDHYREKGEHIVSTEDYKKNLIQYVEEAKGKGAIPILVTPMCRRIFGENGKIKKEFDDYPDTMKAAAKETSTPLIDLEEISFQEFGKLTQEQTKDYFLYLVPDKYEAFPKGKTDGVHFQKNGARHLASWVVEDAKKQNLPVAKLFK